MRANLRLPVGLFVAALLLAGVPGVAVVDAALGGSAIDERGAFSGKWTDVRNPSESPTFDVPAASALVVRIESSK